MAQNQTTLIECFERAEMERRRRLEELRFERLCLLYLLPEDLKALRPEGPAPVARPQKRGGREANTK